MGASRACLLESRTDFLELAEVVSQLSPTEEVGCTRDGEIFDTEVDPEDRPVLGGVPLGVGLVSAETEV